MIKIKFLVIFAFIALFAITSCSEDNTKPSPYGQDNIINSFSRNNNLNQKNSDGIYTIENIITTDNDVNMLLKGLVMTVDIINKRGYFTKNNEIGSVAFNLIIKDEVSQVYELQLIENNENFAKVPRWLCVSQCVLVGFEMSLLDGPAPLMDLAAAFYVTACVQDC